MSGAAFYCVADDRYFIGAAGLINSLRLTGHTEPIYVLDCGLTAAQRDRLTPQATLVEGPRDAPPWLLKTVAPLRNPTRVMILVDADVVATRRLADPIRQAAAGHVVAFRNDRDRFDERWGSLLALGPIRRRPYVSSGIVLLGGDEGAEVLELLDDRQRSVDIEQGYYGRRVRSYPFTYPEQDVLNAILCARPYAGLTLRLPARLAATPPYRGLEVLDPATLRCAYRDGAEPYALHQIVRKPWLETAYHSPYSRLLARSLLGDDVPIRVAPSELPLRMREGGLARLDRARADAWDLGRWYLAERGPRWMRRQVARLSGGDAAPAGEEGR